KPNGPEIPASYVTDSLERLVQLYQETDRLEKAAMWRKRLLRALQLHGLLAFDKRRFAEAELAAKRITELDPKDPEGPVLFALILSQRGQLSEAEAELRKALTLREEHAPAHAGLGVVLARLGRWDKAKDELRRALVLEPNDLDGWDRL